MKSIPHAMAIITRRVASLYGMPDKSLRSRTRRQPIALARQLSMFLIHELLPAPRDQIARFFRRDPTDVTASIRRIRSLWETEPGFSLSLDELRSELMEDHQLW